MDAMFYFNLADKLFWCDIVLVICALVLIQTVPMADKRKRAIKAIAIINLISLSFLMIR